MTDKIETIRKEFEDHRDFFDVILNDYDIFQNIIRRLVEKQEKHGDLWIDYSIADLDKRVEYIFKVYESRKCIKELQQKSLLDLINQSILLLIRLKQENNFLKEYEL